MSFVCLFTLLVVEFHFMGCHIYSFVFLKSCTLPSELASDLHIAFTIILLPRLVSMCFLFMICVDGVAYPRLVSS